MTPRNETDSLGAVEVPREAYYGAQTQRAKENFQISGLLMPGPFLSALARIKAQAAEVNCDLGLLEKKLAQPIAAAAREVVKGKHAFQFPVEVFQTGSGTSTNMNMNEVIAGRANEMLTRKRGGKSPVHPNDHVNKGQSSNDIIPSALHLAALLGLGDHLKPALGVLQQSLEKQALALASVVKTGRTHLQDAVPVTLGQEFSGYARQVELAISRIKAAEKDLCELPLGGTAVGTGINTHPEFAGRVIAGLAEETSLPLIEAVNHFEAQAARDGAVAVSGALRGLAVSLTKIANDIRWLASGPRMGLGEISIPSLQPGSSIMPGKINPVVPEAVIQAAAQVTGNDLTIALGGQGGYFELNTMQPLIAYNLLQSIELMSGAALTFAEKCIDGIEPDLERTAASLEGNLSLVTFLAPAIGYDQAAALAHEAHEEGKNIRELALEKGLLSEEELDGLLKNLT